MLERNYLCLLSGVCENRGERTWLAKWHPLDNNLLADKQVEILNCLLLILSRNVADHA